LKYKITQLEPYFDQTEIKNLTEVIKTGWVTEGPFSKLFIEKIKKITGAKHALLASNGTTGLFLSLLSLELNRDDEVLVPNFTFNASGASIVFAGAKPVFIDINSDDLQINVNEIESHITSHTKAIMPVHLYGQACDMSPIIEIAKKYNLKIVEDAAQSFGIFYKGKHTGTLGDIGVISFFADKTITTGEGAVILTNNESLFEKVKLLRNQGRLNSGTFIHSVLGMNFRMTDLQCAVGVAQIDKLEKIKKIKSRNYNLYKSSLDKIQQIKFIKLNDYCNHIPFRFNIRTSNLDGLIEHLENNQIQTRKFFYPLHRQPCYDFLNNKEKDYPESNMAYEEGLSLPVHTKLTEDDIKYICKVIADYYVAS
jgi:perosamine synthetase